MATKFADFVSELEAEAKAEGPAAIKQLEAFREHFRVGRKLAQARLAKKLTQKQVASSAKVNQADLSKIERGMAWRTRRLRRSAPLPWRWATRST